METHDVSIKWAPGHMDIEGNEAADRLANLEACHPSYPTGKADTPTLSGIKSIAQQLLHGKQQSWWSNKRKKLSKWYNSWDLAYTPRNRPAKLNLLRATLAKLLSIRSAHGDFA
jgi:hypothetical protein